MIDFCTEKDEQFDEHTHLIYNKKYMDLCKHVSHKHCGCG